MFETSWLALDTKVVLKGPQYFEHSSKELLSFLWLNMILSLSQFTNDDECYCIFHTNAKEVHDMGLITN